jgi:hypothetical protein
MSLFNAADVECPHCGRKQELPLVASVNAGRRPDLRQAILERTFQFAQCDVCETPLRLPLHMTYLDLGRGAWILAQTVEELPQWEQAVAEARETFDDTYGEAAPASVRSLAEGVSPRIVFGWPALREKIVCNDLGLDDVVVETIKAGILRARPDAPIDLERALRLAAGDVATLVFEIVDEDTEEVQGAVTVPRSLYDDVAADEAWAPLRAQIGGSPFVDLKRLMVEPAPA